MLTRVIEILTAPVLIAQFSVMLIALLWSFLIFEAPTMALYEAFLTGAHEFKPLVVR